MEGGEEGGNTGRRKGREERKEGVKGEHNISQKVKTKGVNQRGSVVLKMSCLPTADIGVDCKNLPSLANNIHNRAVTNNQ